MTPFVIAVPEGSTRHSTFMPGYLRSSVRWFFMMMSGA
jgi:hypothetical protein